MEIGLVSNNTDNLAIDNPNDITNLRLNHEGRIQYSVDNGKNFRNLSKKDWVNVLITAIGSGGGANGKSAYEIWLALGNTGTEEDFINSLKGADVKISKIEPIIGGQKISFLYYDNGIQKIDSISVMNGKDGVSVKDIRLENNVLIFTLSNDKEIPAGTIVIDESKLKLENFYNKEETDEKFVSKVEIDELISLKIQSMFTPVSEEAIRNLFK